MASGGSAPRTLASSANSAQMELEAARADVMSAEKEITKIKSALKALAIAAASKPASTSGGGGTTDEKDSGCSPSSDSGDGNENSLKVYATKVRSFLVCKKLITYVVLLG